MTLSAQVAKKYGLGIFAKPSVAVKKFIDSRNPDITSLGIVNLLP
jgi:hypothetical protein